MAEVEVLLSLRLLKAALLLGVPGSVSEGTLLLVLPLSFSFFRFPGLACGLRCEDELVTTAAQTLGRWVGLCQF